MLQDYEIPSCGIDLRLQLSHIELGYISKALKLSKGNKTRAASMLGLNRTTLIEKMRRLGLKLRHRNGRPTKTEGEIQNAN